MWVRVRLGAAWACAQCSGLITTGLLSAVCTCHTWEFMHTIEGVLGVGRSEGARVQQPSGQFRPLVFCGILTGQGGGQGYSCMCGVGAQWPERCRVTSGTVRGSL